MGLPATPNTAADSLEIIGQFVKDMEFVWPADLPKDAAQVEKDITEIIESWDLGEMAEGCFKYVNYGIIIATHFYGHLPSYRCRVLLGAITAAAVWVDYHQDDIPEALAQFTGRLCAGRPQLHPALDHLLKLHSELFEYYDEIVANQMIIGTIAFVEGTFIEPRTMGPDAELSKHATMFPTFVRNFSGMCGFYAWGPFTKDVHPDSAKYIQAFPQMSAWTSFVNDVMSFYKEELIDEKHNYIQSTARITGSDALDVLKKTAQDTVEAHQQVRLILADYPGAVEAWDRYVMGTLAFYFTIPNYKIPKSLVP